MKRLTDYQLDAVYRMQNGCILKGDVGLGKSLTSLAYFYKQCGGNPASLMSGILKPMDLLIITTAKKRDSKDWEEELESLNLEGVNVKIDSWNNIKKYPEKFVGGFVIFDEQRVVGWGAWSKSFVKLAQTNNWILLSATPGDTWSDYIPVFVANGFYRNKTDFARRHIIYAQHRDFPVIERYVGTKYLERLRDAILVDMDYNRPTKQHHENLFVEYDATTYKTITKTRWDPYKDEPIQNAGAYCYTVRRVVNSSLQRLHLTEEIVRKRHRVIIFYNFDYELELLKSADYGAGFEIAEWNGHKHEPIPDSDRWVYLVQYTAGAEGWNCILTDTIIFYSQNYSYKIMHQAAGRIDRMNTPFRDLFYYHLMSRAPIDVAICKAISMKKQFNENAFASKLKGEGS